MAQGGAREESIEGVCCVKKSGTCLRSRPQLLSDSGYSSRHC